MKKYIVTLNEEERAQLEKAVTAGKAAARKLTRARILLKVDSAPGGPAWTDQTVGQALDVDVKTVAHVRQAFVEEGFEVAWQGHATRNRRARKIDGECEAHLIALLCQPAPAGHERWTLRLLATRLVQLEYIDSVSHETVRHTLGTNDLKPWQKEEWCIPPEKSGEFVSRMEDVLEVYTQPEDPAYPLVCIDELSKQLVSETRAPLPAQPGQPQRYDYEYRREGVCNIFMVFALLLGQRWVTITDQRTYQDIAYLLRELVDVRFPDAIRIKVVTDNLNIHSGAALYETFEPAEAKRILDRLEFHFTPKHGSWLNMAEIELSVLSRQCLDRRIGTVRLLKTEVTAWSAERNAAQVSVDWRFTTADARIKLKRLYPVPQPDASQSAVPALAPRAATESALKARRRVHKRTQRKAGRHSQGK
jgi:DDE superfamily endonuclease/Homeodomain-like domain